MVLNFFLVGARRSPPGGAQLHTLLLLLRQAADVSENTKHGFAAKWMNASVFGTRSLRPAKGAVGAGRHIQSWWPKLDYLCLPACAWLCLTVPACVSACACLFLPVLPELACLRVLACVCSICVATVSSA